MGHFDTFWPNRGYVLTGSRGYGYISIGPVRLEYPTIYITCEEDSMTVKPLGDRILVKLEKEDEKTSSGLYIPETAQEKTQIGAVVAVGDDEEIKVKNGDRVMYDKYSGTTIKIDSEDHLILSMGDVLAVVS